MRKTPNLVSVIIAVVKHHDQKQVAEESIYVAYIFTALFIASKEVGWALKQVRYLEAGADSESWTGAAY